MREYHGSRSPISTKNGIDSRRISLSVQLSPFRRDTPECPAPAEAGSGPLFGPGNDYWEALFAIMARACLVRSSRSLGVKRRSPLTHRLLGLLRVPSVATFVMSIFSPRIVRGMPLAISIASWQSLMDIFGGRTGKRFLSAMMMTRASLVRSSCSLRVKRRSPLTHRLLGLLRVPSVATFVMSIFSP